MKLTLPPIYKRALTLISVSLAPFLAVTPAYAQTTKWSGDCVSGGVATIQGLSCLLGNIFTIALSGLGFAVFVMILIAGYRYLVSGGNSKGTETAKNTLTYAVLGIVLALSGFIILRLIADFTGLNLTTFSIPK
jgi:hypothetical protein